MTPDGRTLISSLCLKSKGCILRRRSSDTGIPPSPHPHSILKTDIHQGSSRHKHHRLVPRLRKPRRWPRCWRLHRRCPRRRHTSRHSSPPLRRTRRKIPPWFPHDVAFHVRHVWSLLRDNAKTIRQYYLLWRAVLLGGPSCYGRAKFHIPVVREHEKYAATQCSDHDAGVGRISVLHDSFHADDVCSS
jgi:hypothetical protein